MASIVVIGAHWGDEGKGKIVDLISQSADIVARFSGGDNAGHTVINDLGEFSLHLIPTGILSPNTTCVIGNGVVLNAETILAELDLVKKLGIDCNRLLISDKAHIVMPYHINLDNVQEEGRGGQAFGTTKRGIGPAYTDKASRIGLRTGDLLNEQALRARLSRAIEEKSSFMRTLGLKPISFDALLSECQNYAIRLKPFIQPVEEYLNQALDRGDEVIFEGAQGTLLDIDFGTYPYVTSSPTTASGVYSGLGIRPRSFDCILGIFKAYTTRVGGGPMPSELLDATGDLLRERAQEFGVTTGRARRCGWFDAVAGYYSVRLNGMTAGALTRLDVLDELDTIKICTAYKLDGTKIDTFPTNENELARCTPVYEESPGWQTPTTQIRQFSHLPKNAKRYIRRLEELVKCPMKLISVGPHREEMIYSEPLI